LSLSIQHEELREVPVGSELSEKMLALLQELAMLRRLDHAYEANPTDAGESEFRQRQKRHEEIAGEIKAVAEEKQSSGATE
jgi:hypothetical protein